MEILRPENLDRVVEILKNGGVIVYPTETTYGLGCDATNQEAVNKIFKIKGRDQGKPFLVVMPTIKMAKEYLEWNELLTEVSKKYWPGAVTVVGKVSKDFFIDGVVSQNQTLAVRVTNYPWLQKLFVNFNKPIVATSANLAGIGEVYDFVKLKNIFDNCEFKPDVIIDAGVLPLNLPSTLVDVTGVELKILRQGEIEVFV